jgi:hypothetical protein
MKTNKCFLVAAGVSLALAFTFSGCSSDDGGGEDNDSVVGVSSSSDGGSTPSSSTMQPSSSSGTTQPSSSSDGGNNIDEQLVSGNNEAWIWCSNYDSDNYCDGIVVQTNGSCIGLRKSKEGSDPWKVGMVYICSTSGNILTMEWCGNTIKLAYTISGNTYTITSSEWCRSDSNGEVQCESAIGTDTYTRQSGISYEIDPNGEIQCGGSDPDDGEFHNSYR